MVQGTASHVGKSLMVAALCRWFAGRGVAVAPFKAQNMSLNAGVTPDGAEIGRAQLLQARAARTVPTAAMNPILLKPETDRRSQVVVRGRVEATHSAREYFAQRDRLWPVVVESLEELRASYELVIAEGAGSPAEINLRDRDIVNMQVAL
jgi:adenosylcobyric acid synthase